MLHRDLSVQLNNAMATNSFLEKPGETVLKCKPPKLMSLNTI